MSAKYELLAGLLRSRLPEFESRGGRLPTEAQLMQAYSMSRQTVRHALRILAEEGLIESRQGSGSYVMEFDRYEPAPANVMEKVVRQAQQEKAEKE